MFKFMKAKEPHLSRERQKLQKDLFSYRRTVQHGFPHKPTALAWEPSLRLLCLGTASGAVKVFGQPGCEFYGQHQNSTAVTKVVFLPNQGRLVTLCDDNSLHLWEVNRSSLVEVKEQALEGKLKKISTMFVEQSGKHLLLGTEGGNIYLLDLASFTMMSDIIYQDVVIQNVPQDYKVNPGAVESISEQPLEPNNLLIGYNRGLIVLWNRVSSTAVKTFVSTQQLESLCWEGVEGRRFVSSHNDGSYMKWDLEGDDKPVEEPVTTYGPYPCRAIRKLIARSLSGKDLLVFSGGLPRSAGTDKYSVSVLHDNEHVVFDFTSKVIDFVVLDTKSSEDSDEDEENTANGQTGTPGEPEALIVLAEEELVAIDLQSPGWKMMNLPYLVSLHASAVTTSQYVSAVPEELWEQLKEAGRAQTSHLYSSRAWPVDGGKLLCAKGASTRRELLLTGHEDGTVRFWDAGGVTLTPIYKFNTSKYFVGDELNEAQPDSEDMEEEWPPYRKTGIFDPYSDDPRFAVKKVVLCALSGTLLVAGTAGQVIVAKFDTEVLDGTIKVITMDIVNDRGDSFVWKGHSPLTPKSEEIHQIRGFQAVSILQLHPPASITCCALQADWGLISAGTSHGLAIMDYVRSKPVAVKCTLNPNDRTGAGDAPITRRKSFKKSLRESFRRLRKGRSTRRTDAASKEVKTPTTRKLNETSSEDQLEAKPVERQIEARTVDDSMSSYVRCLYFARTFLLNVNNTNPTLWAGTNNGTVYAFTITVPTSSKRDSEDVLCSLAKEVQLKHRAPVIAIAVLDGANKPLPEPLEVEKGIAPLPETSQAHRVILASEEQFKIFTLPSLKPFGKYKLTAHEGSRVRRMAFANFASGNHTEVDLLCLTNLGDCLVLSIPDLKRQLNSAAIKREDINGISSLVFTKQAEALYLHSSSELQRISLSATHITSARCYLPLASKEQEQEEAEPQEESALVNGSVNNKSSTEEIRENGEDNQLNTTIASSVGDITIDSVKEHLSSSGEDLSKKKSVNEATSSSTITTTTIVSSETIVNSSSNSQETTISSVVVDQSSTLLEVKKCDLLLQAPLAQADEDEE